MKIALTPHAPPPSPSPHSYKLADLPRPGQSFHRGAQTCEGHCSFVSRQTMMMLLNSLGKLAFLLRLQES